MIMLYLYRQSVANYINSVPVGSVPVGVSVYSDNPAPIVSQLRNIDAYGIAVYKNE